MDYILTNAGETLITKAVAGGNLVFTRAETGTGYSSSPTMLAAVIGKQQEMSMSVSQEGSDIKIICLQSNVELEQGYLLKQVGIYAKLAEDEDDVLMIIGQQETGELIHPYAEGEAECEFTTLMKASGMESITVEGGVGSLALKKDLFAHTNRQDNPHNVTKKQIGLDKVPNVATDDQTPTVEDLTEREPLKSGDSMKILFSKIKKWLGELKAAAFVGLANNCTTTEEGYALDARQGKALQDEVDEINSNITTIKTNFTDGCSTIAAAITSQGVSTAANASPATMAANIKKACNNKYNAGVAASSPHIVKLGNFSFSSGETAGSAVEKSASFSIPAAAQGKTHYVYPIVTSGSHDPGRGIVTGKINSLGASSNGTTATVTASLNPGNAGGADFTVSGYCICIY